MRKRQIIKSKEIIAVCYSSLASASASGASRKVLEGATEALRDYIAEAESTLQHKKEREKELAAVLAEETSKAYLIQPS